VSWRHRAAETRRFGGIKAHLRCRRLPHLVPVVPRCRGGQRPQRPTRAFHPHTRAKKLPRAAECLVYSLTPSGGLAENHPKNRGFVGILRVKNA